MTFNITQKEWINQGEKKKLKKKKEFQEKVSCMKVFGQEKFLKTSVEIEGMESVIKY